MIYASTFAFVLALVAVVSVAVVWIISSHRMRALELRQGGTVSNLKLCVQRIDELRRSVSEAKSTAPTTLAAEVVDLREAVEKLAATQRRFQGRFDATRQHEPVANGDAGSDDELAALLALQTAPPGGP